MIIDVVCAAFCLVYAVLGFLSGGLKQLVKLVAVILAFFSANWASPIFASILSQYIKISSNYLEIIALLVAWICFYIIFSIIGRIFARMLYEASETISGLDNIVGMILGLAKALVIIFLLSWVVNSYRSTIIHHRPESRQTLNESYVMKTASKVNSLSDVLPDETVDMVDFLGNLTNNLKIGESSPGSSSKNNYIKNLTGSKKNKKAQPKEDPAKLAVKKVQNSEKGDAIEELKKHKSFKKVLDDKEFMDSIKDKNRQELINDPRVKELMENPQIMNLIKAIQGGNKTPQAGTPK